jgi:hypothetical protein
LALRLSAGSFTLLLKPLSDVGSMISLAMNVIKQQGNGKPEIAKAE